MGLLDFLQSPDAQLGIGLLAAGGPTTDPNQAGFGQRLAGVMQGLDARKRADLQGKLIQSQIDENASQNQLRQSQMSLAQRNLAIQNQLLGLGAPPQGAPMTQPGALPAAGAMPQGAGVAPGPGAGGVNGVTAPQAGAGTLDAMAKQYGIPAEALKYDLVFNGGKGIAEMVAKRGTPDMQVSNGYAYDKNKLGAGYLPQLNMSQDGKASMVQIGPDGLPVVSAPQGAVQTYGDYRNKDAESKLIKVFNNQTKQEEYVPEAELLRRPQVPTASPAQAAMPPGTIPNAAGRPSVAPQVQASRQNDVVQILQQERAAANQQFERARAAGDLTAMARSKVDIESLDRELRNAGFKGASPAPSAPAAASASPASLAAGPSAQDQVQSKFNEKMALEQADMLTKSATGAKSASDELLGIQEARKAIDSGVFAGSGANQKLAISKFINANVPGLNIDPEKVGNTDYLKSTLGRGLLEQAKTLGSNPSNADASRINDIVGDIGKDPMAMRKILDWRQDMAVRAIAQHNQKIDQAEASGFKPQFDMRVQNPLGKSDAAAGQKSFKDYGYASPADALKDAQNAMLRNPAAKAEILRRLSAMGIDGGPK